MKATNVFAKLPIHFHDTYKDVVEQDFRISHLNCTTWKNKQ